MRTALMSVPLAFLLAGSAAAASLPDFCRLPVYSATSAGKTFVLDYRGRKAGIYGTPDVFLVLPNGREIALLSAYSNGVYAEQLQNGNNRSGLVSTGNFEYTDGGGLKIPDLDELTDGAVPPGLVWRETGCHDLTHG